MRRMHIEHVTEYRFDAAVTLLPHRVMVRPRENHNVRVATSQLTIFPAHVIRWQRDVLDNSIAVVTFPQPATSLRIESQVVVEHWDERPLDFMLEERARFHPFQYDDDDAATLLPFRSPVWPRDQGALIQWLSTLDLWNGIDAFALLDRINRRIAQLRYQAREEPGVQSPAQTLARSSGSCRDFAALFMEACRYLGFAARFVSGYHTSYASDRGMGATHAWAEVYLPGPGWKAFDPSAGALAGSQHIAVAVAGHPEKVPPVAGSYIGSASRPVMQVVVRVDELAL